MRYQIVAQMGDTDQTVVLTPLSAEAKQAASTRMKTTITSTFTVAVKTESECACVDSAAAENIRRLGGDPDALPIETAKFNWTTPTDGPRLVPGDRFTVRAVALASAKTTLTDVSPIRPPRD